jgi:flagella basal body P-ring formation protein FlgA
VVTIRLGPTYLIPLLLLLAPGAARAAGPVVVALRDRASAPVAAVTVGDVAAVTGGDAAARDRIARLDLAELKARDPGVALTRRAVEYRLRLAGLDPAEVLVTGAERVTVTAARRAVTPDEVVNAARAELLRRLAVPADAVSAEPVAPVAVRLPEVPIGETPVIAAVPHAKAVGPGRNQMDVTISGGGEKLLALAVLFEVKPAGAGGKMPVPQDGVVPAGGAVPGTPAVKPAAAEVAVKPRDRVTMVVRLGATNVTAVGEAQQGGAVGQVIPVQNVDSKKVISARVTGPGMVEVELPRAP